MKLSKKDRDKLYWYFLIPAIIGVTIIISLSPWLFHLLATPYDRIFNGMNLWSRDYMTYLSYVTLGKRGVLGAELLFTTMPQKPVFFHMFSVIPGYILGHLIGLNQIFIYHFIRIFYGTIFLFLTILMFYKTSKSKLVSLLGFMLVFYIGGFAKIESLFTLKASKYLAWFDGQNILTRATGPIHYSAGSIFFILIYLWFFNSKKPSVYKMIILSILLNLALFANPFAGLVAATTLTLYCFLRIISSLPKLSIVFPEVAMIVASLLLLIPGLVYHNYFLSREPWGPTSLSPKYFAFIPFVPNIKETFLAIGPIFFLGLSGILAYLFRRKSSNIPTSHFLFLTSQLFVQFFLFFFGSYFRIHPFRSFSGLYYLPLAIFSAYFIIIVARKWVFLIIILLFLITFPTYFTYYKEQLFLFSDLKKDFSTLVFPTKKQFEAFNFLEKNTPTATGVLASFEASHLIFGFSANSTNLYLDIPTQVKFFGNLMSEETAYNFLTSNRFQYVYYGYQEKSIGGNIEKYPFLKKIFENSQVAIYKVSPKPKLL